MHTSDIQCLLRYCGLLFVNSMTKTGQHTDPCCTHSREFDFVVCEQLFCVCWISIVWLLPCRYLLNICLAYPFIRSFSCLQRSSYALKKSFARANIMLVTVSMSFKVSLIHSASFTMADCAGLLSVKPCWSQVKRLCRSHDSLICSRLRSRSLYNKLEVRIWVYSCDSPLFTIP